MIHLSAALLPNTYFCRMKKNLSLTILLLGICSWLHAQGQTQFSGWLATFNTFKTGKKTSIHNDIQWRSSDEFKHTQTFLFRAGLNYHVRKNMIATAGYAFIHNRRTVSGVSGYAPEHRIWEQFIISHKISKAAVTHRFRLEQRFITRSVINGTELKNDGHVYANRFRYFIRSVIPVNTQKGSSFTKGPFAAIQNEVFVNVGNKANVNGEFFDQNRLYLAGGYRLSRSFDLEAGYMNQYINGRGSAFTNNHIVQLATYIRL